MTTTLSGTGKVALITGITGQDGSYLAEFLLEQGYEVHGIIRRSSSFNTGRLDHIFGSIKLHYGDMIDSSNLASILARVRPHEIYNLAAQSHVKVSFEMPEYTGETTGLGTMRLLEAIRTCGLEKHSRFYQASSSELYGKVMEVPQKETTPFYPRSPYGVAKLYAFWAVKNYREAYGMYCCNGILFNHESPRRGGTFVTKKITASIARIVAGNLDCLQLGNLSSQRDWGHAKDYVRAMWAMLQQEEADDFVIATGVMYSVREFATLCFKMAGFDITWQGKDEDEVGIDAQTGKVLVKVNPAYYRPTEVEELLGDATKARKHLDWIPAMSLKELAYDMMYYDFSVNGLDLPPVAKEHLDNDTFQVTCSVELQARSKSTQGAEVNVRKV